LQVSAFFRKFASLQPIKRSFKMSDMTIRFKTILTLFLVFAVLPAPADKASISDTVARRLSREFNRYYIDGNEKMVYQKADELSRHLKSMPVFDHHLYYATQIDLVSFDMNQGHYYRAMKKAKEMMTEMRSKQHTEEFYNGSYMMAIIYWYRNNLPLASKYFEQALRKIPRERHSDRASIMTDYANMLTEDEPEKAAQLIDQAIQESGSDSYKLTYALTMKGIIAFTRKDGQTTLDCYRQYLDLKQHHKPEEICDMYESHLHLGAIAVNGRAREAMQLAEKELDNSDRYAIQLDICNYIGDRSTAYGILKKVMKEQELQNNLIMEDDVNEMNADLQVIEARRETERYWMIFLVVMVALSFVIIGCLVVIVHNRRRSLRQLRQAYDQLEEATSLRERIESELRIARDIQESMLPSVFPNRAGLDLYASMTPAREVGGDFYNFLLTGHRLYFCVSDVSGKGIPASLFMAQATRLFRTLAAQDMQPAEICDRLNDVLTEDNEQGMFVTMFVGLLDLASGRLDFCNAGHNPPVIGGSDDRGHFLQMVPNAPIGLWPGLSFEGEHLDDITGHPLFIYTDGLNEAENSRQQQFGDDQLLSVLRSTPFESSRQVIETMTTEVEAFRAGAEPSDDLTMLCLRLEPQA